jgi:hypothetical protein
VVVCQPIAELELGFEGHALAEVVAVFGMDSVVKYLWAAHWQNKFGYGNDSWILMYFSNEMLNANGIYKINQIIHC